MKTRDEILGVLRDQKLLLLETYHVTRIGVFGSYARGEQKDDSDVDILVDYENAPSLYRLIDLRDYLSDLFGVRVDVVTKNGLRDRVRERVLGEVIYL